MYISDLTAWYACVVVAVTVGVTSYYLLGFKPTSQDGTHG